MIAEAFLAHLAGDYLLQSDWMATQKVKRWWPAVVHGTTYTLPFALLTQSPWALLIIGGTHIVLDRYRLARYAIWARNLLAPRTARAPWTATSTNFGSRPQTPAGLASALVIVADNTIHLAINAAALTWLA